MADGVLQNNELLGIIKRVSSETGVPANIIAATAQQETGGKWHNKVSDGTGYSYGYMMLYDNGVIADLKAKGKSDFAEKAKVDPYTNVLAGAQYLANNYKKYGNWEQALAKYNGSGAAAQAYGKKVWQRANTSDYTNLVYGTPSSSVLSDANSSVTSKKSAYIDSLFNNQDSKTSAMKNKVSDFLKSSIKTINPFLNKDGSLVNPYMNYQKILDSGNVSERAKSFIQQATGLTPTVKHQNTVASSTGGSYTAYGGNSQSVPVSATGNTIADAAQKYIGTPYVWGGESASEGGMDCSGFVYNALKDAGYNVDRTTAQGYRSYGTSVSKSDMKPGDLVFFGKNNNASHIGIYIGNGQMIHSSGGSKNTKSNPGKGVSITNVDYRSDFLEARRY